MSCCTQRSGYQQISSTCFDRFIRWGCLSRRVEKRDIESSEAAQARAWLKGEHKLGYLRLDINSLNVGLADDDHQKVVGTLFSIALTRVLLVIEGIIAAVSLFCMIALSISIKDMSSNGSSDSSQLEQYALSLALSCFFLLASTMAALMTSYVTTREYRELKQTLGAEGDLYGDL